MGLAGMRSSPPVSPFLAAYNGPNSNHLNGPAIESTSRYGISAPNIDTTFAQVLLVQRIDYHIFVFPPAPPNALDFAASSALSLAHPQHGATTPRDSWSIRCRPFHLWRARPDQFQCYATAPLILICVCPDAGVGILQQHVHYAEFASQKPRPFGRVPAQSNTHPRPAPCLSRQCICYVLWEQPNLCVRRLRSVHRRGVQPCATPRPGQPPVDSC